MRATALPFLLALTAAFSAHGQGSVSKDQALALCQEQGEMAFKATNAEQMAEMRRQYQPSSTTTTCQTFGSQTTCTTGPNGWATPIGSGARGGVNAYVAADNARQWAVINCMKRLGFE